MAFINPYIMANKNGIPRLESTGVAVGASNVRFSFPQSSVPFRSFQRVDIVPAGTADTDRYDGYASGSV